MTLLILIAVVLCCLIALALLAGLALGRAAASEDECLLPGRLLLDLLAQNERSGELDAVAAEVDAIASEVGEIACEIAGVASGAHREADMLRLRILESQISAHRQEADPSRSRMPAEAA